MQHLFSCYLSEGLRWQKSSINKCICKRLLLNEALQHLRKCNIFSLVTYHKVFVDKSLQLINALFMLTDSGLLKCIIHELQPYLTVFSLIFFMGKGFIEAIIEKKNNYMIHLFLWPDVSVIWDVAKCCNISIVIK